MDLVTYYNDTVKANDSGERWAYYYYGIASDVINKNNYKVALEVGIGYGTHAKNILKNTNVATLFLVDPMRQYENDGFSDDIMRQIPKIHGKNFDELYGLIQNELSPWAARTVFIRKPSLEVTEIPDGSVDFIFLDGDHSYTAVLADLKHWMPKLASGGMLMGDDYWMADVARAVHEYEASADRKADFIVKPSSGYKLYTFSNK